MPRQARIAIPGFLYHVTQRGNYKQIVFEEDFDRVKYLKFIQEYSQKYGLEIFAYCLMNNHVHFIVRPKEESSLSETFCRAHQRYSQHFHKKKKLKGHLWQERFYSCLLFGEHIRQSIRYVERNPVRAGLVGAPWLYPWSSTRAHLGKKYEIITLCEIKEFIDVSSWKDYLAQEESESELKNIREYTARGKILAPEEVVEKIIGDNRYNK